MEPQWTAYSEAPGSRYSHSMASSSHASRDASVSSQIKPDPYTTPSRQNSMPLQSPGATATRGPEYNDGDGDVPMEDAYKPRLNMARPTQQQRQSQQFLQQEESAAARRYSPMNLSPTSPYTGAAQQGGQNYTSFTPQAQAQTQANRQSPTRNNPYMSPPNNNNNYYSPPCRFSLCFDILQS